MQDITLSKIYQPLYDNSKRFVYVTGTRGTGKSYAISITILFFYLKSQNVAVIRKNSSTIEMTAVAKFKKIIKEQGYKIATGNESKANCRYHWHASQRKITDLSTGHYIVFLGMTPPDRIKSLDDINIGFVEEVGEINNEYDMSIVEGSFRDFGFKIIFAGNNDLVSYSFLYKWVKNLENTNIFAKIETKPSDNLGLNQERVELNKALYGNSKIGKNREGQYIENEPSPLIRFKIFKDNKKAEIDLPIIFAGKIYTVSFNIYEPYDIYIYAISEKNEIENRELNYSRYYAQNERQASIFSYFYNLFIHEKLESLIAELASVFFVEKEDGIIERGTNSHFRYYQVFIYFLNAIDRELKARGVAI